MTRRIVLAGLVGLVMIGVGAQHALGTSYKCYPCVCIPASGPTTITACFSDATFTGSGSCPACPAGSDQSVEPTSQACNELPACLALVPPSPAPALSGVGLASVGALLLGGGIWLTRKRTRAAA
jgi:hypothetical protein